MTSKLQTPPPLSDTDNLDVVGQRKDGGVDMLVVTNGSLDASDATCQHLEQKLSAYLLAATHENFPKVYPAAHSGRTRIFVSDRHSVSDRARRVVEVFATQAMARNVEVCIGDPVA